jgi:transcriptional regulator with XRE-family HTH domain
MEERFGEALRRLRGNRSLRQLGLLSYCSKSYLWDLETGRRKPTPEIAKTLERALDAQGELLPLVPRPDTPQPSQRKIDHQAALPTTAVRLPLPPAGEDVPSDATAISSFRAADRQLGGGHLYGSVLHYLHHNVGPRIFGSKEDREPDQTLLAAASLTELAGWMAHDSGHDARAREHFGKALSLAQAGNDLTLGANIMASMSHLALQTGRPNEAVSLAQAGRSSGNVDLRAPALSSRLYAMEARALAKLGETDATQRALDVAHDELATSPHDAPSRWTSSFDAAALASESALSLQDLGKLSAAFTEAERAVSLRTGDRARSRVFGQI